MAVLAEVSQRTRTHTSFLLLCQRFDSDKAGDREVQRTMLELLNQLDGFQPNDDIKVSLLVHLRTSALAHLQILLFHALISS